MTPKDQLENYLETTCFGVKFNPLSISGVQSMCFYFQKNDLTLKWPLEMSPIIKPRLLSDGPPQTVQFSHETFLNKMPYFRDIEMLKLKLGTLYKN